MSTPGTNATGFAGQQSVIDGNSDFNRIHFLIRQSLGTVRTSIPVRVEGVTNSGGVSPVGTVDILPLVDMTDGQGNTTPHGTIYGIPYTRLQGGANAIIIDPEIGDIGWVLVCDRDISAVKAAKASAPPGSWRRFDFADAIYVGGMLNDAPEQYVRFYSGGMTLADKNGNTVVMDSAGITINGILFSRSQNITLVHEITAIGGHTLTQHTHGVAGAQTGSSTLTSSTPTG